jgi:LysR family glycine cleavage system transcriptional activator
MGGHHSRRDWPQESPVFCRWCEANSHLRDNPAGTDWTVPDADVDAERTQACNSAIAVRERDTKSTRRPARAAPAVSEPPMNPWHRLPPLRSFRVLEAAARHQNYTRAADELHLTHSAVSHQIHALEESLGTRLFERNGRQMRATEAGRQLAHDVRATLDALAAAVERVRGGDAGNSITVSVLPSFAAAWLVGRLGGFLENNPQIELRLESTTALADFRNDGVDMAIRYGSGGYDGCESIKLFDDDLFPTMSPKLFRSLRVRAPADLARVPLLRIRNQPWAPWFAAAGVSLAEPRRGSVFSDSELALQAAIQGQGAVLARGSLAAGKLRAGTLVAPFKHRIPSPQTCWLVYPPQNARKPAVQLFRDWLLEELRVAPPVYAGK